MTKREASELMHLISKQTRKTAKKRTAYTKRNHSDDLKTRFNAHRSDYKRFN